jgi:hypothetical protein
VLVLATEAPKLAPPELAARAAALDRLLPRFDPPLAAIARGRMDIDLAAAGALVLRDDFAPVDRLIRLGDAARREPWRDGG